jgi:transposase
MLGPPKTRDLDRPVLASLEALVPANHFYRHLDAQLDLTFVRELVADRYAAGGRPSIDPVVFFRLQLIMFFEGLRSERKLMETVALHLAHRWYLGYHLDEPLPDHASLTRIRQRLGLEVFQRFFEHIIDRCREAGLVWGEELFVDATKVRANASVDSLVPRWYQQAQAHVDALFAADPEEPPRPPGDAPPAAGERSAQPLAAAPDSSTGASHREPIPLPTPGTVEEQAQLAAANRATWKLLERCRLDPARPAGSSGYQRTSDRSVSRTDPDAAPMRRHHGDRLALGYHDHSVVDGGRHRIILAALVTPADVMENQAMLDLLWRVRFRWRLHPKRAVGDTTYGTIEHIRALEDAGIRAYVPLADWDRTPYYGPSQFTYDAERDEYRCPRGQPLRRYTAKYTEEVVVSRAAAATCNACPVKAQCTASERGRTVHRSFPEEYLERVQAYHATAADRKALRKRQVWVEPLFGEAKAWHGLRRFRLRGLANVNMEGLLIAAGQNLKRWLVATGWGRRHGPTGSLAAVAPAGRPGLRVV